MTRETIIAIWVNGRGVSSRLTRRVLTLSFELSGKKASSGSLVIRDKDSEVFDTRMFKKGQVLHFLAGWASEAKPMGPYVVKTQKMGYPASGDPALTVKFQDLSLKLNNKTKRKKHVGKATDILKRIAKAHGLGYDIDSIDGLTFTEDFPLMQTSISDAKLLQMLSDRYGFHWGVEGGNLVFKRPADRQTRKSVDPKVLSYRINDWTLESFDPDLKYSRGGKKKAAKSTTNNIDLLKGSSDLGYFELLSNPGEMTEDAKNELFAEHKSDGDDGVIPEKSISESLIANAGGSLTDFFNPVGEQMSLEGPARGQATLSTHSKEIQRDVALHSDDGLEDDPDADGQSIYHDRWEWDFDESGVATPADVAEAARREKAKLLRLREVVTAKAIPKTASMFFFPGETIVLGGLGKFFSGAYLIKDVGLIFGRGGQPFQTSLSVSRSRLGTTKEALEHLRRQEEKVRNAAATPGTADSGDWSKQPEPVDLSLDYGGVLVGFVDGTPG